MMTLTLLLFHKDGKIKSSSLFLHLFNHLGMRVRVTSKLDINVERSEKEMLFYFALLLDLTSLRSHLILHLQLTSNLQSVSK